MSMRWLALALCLLCVMLAPASAQDYSFGEPVVEIEIRLDYVGPCSGPLVDYLPALCFDFRISTGYHLVLFFVHWELSPSTLLIIDSEGREIIHQLKPLPI